MQASSAPSIAGSSKDVSGAQATTTQPSGRSSRVMPRTDQVGSKALLCWDEVGVELEISDLT